MSPETPQGSAIDTALALLNAFQEAREGTTVHQAQLFLQVTKLYQDGAEAPTQEEIGDHLSIQQGAVSRIIKKFVEDGLMTKELAPGSELYKVYQLTPKGRGLLIKIRNILK